MKTTPVKPQVVSRLLALHARNKNSTLSRMTGVRNTNNNAATMGQSSTSGGASSSTAENPPQQQQEQNPTPSRGTYPKKALMPKHMQPNAQAGADAQPSTGGNPKKIPPAVAPKPKLTRPMPPADLAGTQAASDQPKKVPPKVAPKPKFTAPTNTGRPYPPNQQPTAFVADRNNLPLPPTPAPRTILNALARYPAVVPAVPPTAPSPSAKPQARAASTSAALQPIPEEDESGNASDTDTKTTANKSSKKAADHAAQAPEEKPSTSKAAPENLLPRRPAPTYASIDELELTEEDTQPRQKEEPKKKPDPALEGLYAKVNKPRTKKPEQPPTEDKNEQAKRAAQSVSPEPLPPRRDPTYMSLDEVQEMSDNEQPSTSQGQGASTKTPPEVAPKPSFYIDKDGKRVAYPLRADQTQDVSESLSDWDEWSDDSGDEDDSSTTRSSTAQARTTHEPSSDTNTDSDPEPDAEEDPDLQNIPPPPPYQAPEFHPQQAAVADEMPATATDEETPPPIPERRASILYSQPETPPATQQAQAQAQPEPEPEPEEQSEPETQPQPPKKPKKSFFERLKFWRK